jgi:hypothetical protein
MAPELGWDEERARAEAEAFTADVATELEVAGIAAVHDASRHDAR